MLTTCELIAAAGLKSPAPGTSVTGSGKWHHHGDMSFLADEAGMVWQTCWRPGPHDTWAGSVQRHETMSDCY